MSTRYTLLIAAVIFSGTLSGQTQVDLRTQSKSVDFTTAPSTKPFSTGASLPATCGVGQMFFLTSAPNGLNNYGCGAPNTWVQQTGTPQSTTIKSSGTSVGSRPVIDVSAGRGAIWATSDTGQEISIQSLIDTSIIQTRADAQAGTILFCNGGSVASPGVAYSCALEPTLTGYTSGMVVNWKPDRNNSGTPTTLNIDALGAVSVVEADGLTVPGSSTIVAGQLYALWYDGSVFRRISSPAPPISSIFISLGPMAAVDSFTFGATAASGWGLAQDYGGGDNVPLGISNGGSSFNAFWQFGTAGTSAIGRWFWVPADYDNTQNVSINFDLGPDTGGGTGNFGMKASIGCIVAGATTWSSGFPVQNVVAPTGAIAVSGTQYMHQQTNTGALNMTGCAAGSLGKLVVYRDTSVAGNSSTTLDLLDAVFNYTRKH